MKKLLLVGLPNAGKSTIFSSLTKKKSHIGNWSGVTVTTNEAVIRLGKESFRVIDLPGIYGLSVFSSEESVSLNEILGDNIVLNVIDCFNLTRSLNLTLQLIEIGCKVVIILNFYDEFLKHGGDINRLVKLGCPIIKANNFSDLEKIITSIKVPKINYLPAEISNCYLKLSDKYSHIEKMFNTIKAFEGDEKSLTINNERLVSLAKNSNKNLELLYKKRRAYIESLVTETKNHYGLSKWDRFLLNPMFASVIFISLFALFFWLAFGLVGENLNLCVENLLNFCKIKTLNVLAKLGAPLYLESFIGEIFFDGIGTVLAFIPQIAILFCGMELIEQSGLIARIVWVFKPMATKLGLDGKSIFAILLGFGCTTTAVPLTKSIKENSVRTKTIFALNFIPCSAKLPVISALCYAVAGELGAMLAFFMYVLPIIIGLMVSLFFNRNKLRMDLRELNQLRFPKSSLIVKLVCSKVFDFIKKIYKVILLCACVFWFLCHFSFSGVYLDNSIESSILASVSKWLMWLFIPLGFSWEHICALILGFPAKELCLVGLSMLGGDRVVDFDITSVVTFLTFFVFYTPCVSALKQIKNNVSKTQFYVYLVLQLLLAYLVASLVRCILLCFNSFGILATILALFVSEFIIFIFSIYLINKPKCHGCFNCDKCK